MIELKNVSYMYECEDEEPSLVLDNVNLTVQEGEFIGVVGHNGCGKSTLAKLINGLLSPTSGDILVMSLNTKDENSLTEIRRNVGMIFQNPDNQMVATIVEEDVAFGVENLGVEPSEIRRLVDVALKSVEMYEFKDRKPHQLSGGQKQRVAIAGILAMHPRCIIFDESTAMLDPAGRAEVLKVMHELNKRDGVTIIFITHYMEELTNVDRIIVMSEGKVVKDASPREIFTSLEEVQKYSLSLPEVGIIADGLRKGGLNIKEGILELSELVDELCQLQ